MADVRARLSGQSEWKYDRFGNWVLHHRRFKLSTRQLSYQRKIGDRWVTYRRWFFSQIDWAAIDKLKRIAEDHHRDATAKAQQFHTEHPDKIVDLHVMVRVKENPDRDGLEIQFSEKPPQATLTALHTHGFRWSKRQHLWYAKQTPGRITFANDLRGSAVHNGEPLQTTPTAPVLIATNGTSFAGAVERSGDLYRGHVNGQPVEARAGEILPVLQDTGVTKVVGVSEPVHQMGIVITG
jgi:hypothetical protein